MYAAARATARGGGGEVRPVSEETAGPSAARETGSETGSEEEQEESVKRREELVERVREANRLSVHWPR